jgi:RND family efflux transporter MFP subunit
MRSVEARRPSCWPVLFLLPFVTIGCSGDKGSATAKPAPAAKVENPKTESDLTTVTLTAEARKHLAIQTARVAMEPVRLSRTVGGELIVQPGKSVVVTAPIAGTLAAGPAANVGPVKRGDVIFELMPLQQPERDVRSEAERLVGETDARLTQATQRLQRQEQLLKEGSASVRSVEEARADRAFAAAASEAAHKRLDSLSRGAVSARGEIALSAPLDGQVISLRAAPGQVVAAGAAVAEVAQTGALWVRVPVYAGDLADLDGSEPVLVSVLGQETTGPWREVRRVSGPPGADPSAASIDLFFTFPGGSPPAMRPGERLSIQLPLKATNRALVVPRAAVVYDINGGTWVYEDRGQNHFTRRRVELAGPAGQRVVIARGLTEGITIVTAGAAELYGTEFYVSK